MSTGVLMSRECMSMSMSMKRMRMTLCLIAVLAAQTCIAASRLTVTVHNETGLERPAETIIIPFVEVKRRLPDLQYDRLVVRDQSGSIIPSQVTAMRHVHQGPSSYDDLLFQHDFGPGEKRAMFIVESSELPAPPFPSKVFARLVSERYDDFAWENDRLAHRAYGPALELPSAGKDRLISSGLDLWPKRVPYLVIDRWYRKGHDGLHHDDGEGLDFFEVGVSRGVGGTGIWDGRTLQASRNWRTWQIYANGPLRAIFDLGYEDWGAEVGVRVRETKRFVVDAGRHLDEIHSRFDFSPPPGSNGTIMVAIGLSEHPAKAEVTTAGGAPLGWASVWEKYHDPQLGELGVGIVTAPDTLAVDLIRVPASATGSAQSFMLVRVKPGQTIRYLAGGGWSKAGTFKDAAQWNGHLAAWAKRLNTPLRISFLETPE